MMAMLSGGQGLAIILLAGCLMAHWVWDWREWILPDLINALIWLLGMAVALWAPLPGCNWSQAWQGSLLALATAWGFYELIWRLRGEEGFGFGDVKLFAACGAWLGPAKLTGMVLVGSLSSLLLMALFALIYRRFHIRMAMPFGPGLILGFLVMMLWPDWLAIIMMRLAT
ncbi:MAG: prepilin peptidase [Alphaproteobacteria bacterium]|nr:prepilin peptidase [Alphaproteobacteria bacterium]